MTIVGIKNLELSSTLTGTSIGLFSATLDEKRKFIADALLKNSRKSYTCATGFISTVSSIDFVSLIGVSEMSLLSLMLLATHNVIKMRYIT